MNAIQEAGWRTVVADAPAVVALGAAAFALRAVFLREVFGSDGMVVLTDPDALYHARRALYSFANSPSVLFFDPYLNHPNGSPVVWPPLYDWTLAAVALALGGSPRAFDLTLARSAPVIAALTVIPVYAVGRMLGGRGTAAAGGALFAALPVGVHFARVARVLVVLSWNGSLLYIGLGEGALLLGAILAGRRVRIGDTELQVEVSAAEVLERGVVPAGELRDRGRDPAPSGGRRVQIHLGSEARRCGAS